eukprot:CAMPEP_0170541774 /NCGR_PEP_ID=MMETSP0211-20121228/1412_1 /TAXON_ID=311385 /ORGANISM="Pseudokeronopsis sp., Strain OXSARD2" /LENGTH=106 /DNA_ID=CAMNT_0010844629 /DNA_START=628 /DNA_END=948 /DNA_ORIENTATION=+
MIIQIYFDYTFQFDRKELIMYLYILMSQDTTADNFTLANKLLQEFIDANVSEYNHLSQKHKKKLDDINQKSAFTGNEQFNMFQQYDNSKKPPSPSTQYHLNRQPMG